MGEGRKFWAAMFWAAALTVALFFSVCSGSWAATRKTRSVAHSRRYHSRHAYRVRHVSYARRHSRYRRYYERPVDPTLGDITRYDDPMVRQAAVGALGHRNGAVLAVDPETGRILTMVNQKLALSEGFEPCSTIKPVVAVAALQKGIISADSMLRVGRRQYMDLTEALAHSNNAFFAQLGTELGFSTVRSYARMFGLGEQAGLNLPDETAGALPSEPPAYGGVGRMSSFGSGFRITPLQLVSMASAIANGGTLYYLQYPKGAEFTPRVKRDLDGIAPSLSDVRDGMLAAVLYGTARESYDPEGEQSLAKTGTCDDETQGGRIGWYVSYADEANPRIAMVVLLRGRSRATNGPRAADIGGRIYKTLRENHFFHEDPTLTPDDTDSNSSGE
jgi:penicillin-binding protein 2